MKNYQLNHDLLMKLLNYLATKPYNEVFNLISELTKLAQEVKE